MLHKKFTVFLFSTLLSWPAFSQDLEYRYAAIQQLTEGIHSRMDLGLLEQTVENLRTLSSCQRANEEINAQVMNNTLTAAGACLVGIVGLSQSTAFLQSLPKAKSTAGIARKPWFSQFRISKNLRNRVVGNSTGQLIPILVIGLGAYYLTSIQPTIEDSIVTDWQQQPNADHGLFVSNILLSMVFPYDPAVDDQAGDEEFQTSLSAAKIVSGKDVVRTYKVLRGKRVTTGIEIGADALFQAHQKLNAYLAELIRKFSC